ncbi:MAG: hypothetical protein ACREFE_14575, partial [Limisphaerales bacterium]
MKNNLDRLTAIALALFIQTGGAYAVTFTSDAFIGVNDDSDDGLDIIVTNCTLTVDGDHAFNSLQVLNGGALTHSFSTNGLLEYMVLDSSEAHVISSTNPAALDNTNADTNSIVVTDDSGGITYTAGSDYLITVSNQFTQLELTTNSAIADGATVLVSYNWTETLNAGFRLVITNDAQIAIGGIINVSSKGCGGGHGIFGGAGAGVTNSLYSSSVGSGGGHGGLGGISSMHAAGGASYDSFTIPTNVGSGGGDGADLGGAGGGSAQLLVGGALQVDGQILADGMNATNPLAGGGAGGSIFISAQTISGAGKISANGGAGEPSDGGGGGGGRIAIYFETNQFTGSLSAFGGAGYVAGGAGTIYTESFTNVPGTLLIANNGIAHGDFGGANTLLDLAAVGINYPRLIVAGSAIVQPSSSALIHLASLYVGSNSWLTVSAQTMLACTVDGDATIESNALINLDFKGYPARTGPGAGGTTAIVG